MTVTASIAYGTSAAVTFTGTSLATSSTLLAGRASAALDNTTEKAVDYSVYFKITTGTSPVANSVIEIWAAASEDGTNYAGGNGGSDANKTHTNESKATMTKVAEIATNATNSIAYEIVISSLAALLGGLLPRKVSFFVVHNTGVNLHSTAGNHVISATPIHFTSV